jgi:phospholipid/cholesterol/gamma-HCH transport system substrate-binding protein
MENRAFALATGLFLVVLGLGFGLWVWWFSGPTVVQDQYLLVTRYSVAGLNNQAAVRYRGIDIGKVQSIELDKTNPLEIRIRVNIDHDTPITKGTFGTLGYQGVTGLAYVSLEDRGTNLQKLVSTDGGPPRIPMKPSFIDIVSDSGMAMLEKASDLLERMNQLLSEKNRASVSRTLDNVETASTRLEPALKNAGDVAALLKKTFSDENNARINRLLANLEQASGEAKPLAGEIRQLVASLKTLSERLDAVSASTSDEVNGVTLPRMHELMGELIRNSRNLNLLLDEFERNPNAIIFGKPPPRAGPGEPSFNK